MGEVTPIRQAGAVNLIPPAPLTAEHDLSLFDCGNDDLNAWLRDYAAKNESLTSRTYVVCEGNRVSGYYCLAMGSVFRTDMPTAKTRKGPQQMPVAVLGRFATDVAYQGMGIGSGMMRDALIRCLEISERIGMRAVISHAKDESLIPYYQSFGFKCSPTNNLTLVLPVETIRTAVAEKPKT